MINKTSRGTKNGDKSTIRTGGKSARMSARDVAKTRNIFVIVFIHGFDFVRVDNGFFY